MKQYVVDQLRYPDFEKLKGYLDQAFGPAALESIYWVPVDPDLLSPIQREHSACGPHAAAIDLEETRLSMELLVRTRKRVRCACIAYATAEQREWLIRRVDDILGQLGISV